MFAVAMKGLGQVEVDVQVVVAERVVLGRVEHLEQRRGGIAPVIATQLVDLVEHHDGVHRAGVADGPHQAARLSTHVGATVATDLGLVAHAAECDPNELATEGAGDRLTERRLADTGRADKGQDGAGTPALDRGELSLGPQLAHGEVLEDAFLDVLQPVVIGVEDASRFGDVEPVFGGLPPRKFEHRVEPGADPPVLGALLTCALELVDLLLDGAAHLVGQVTIGDLSAEVVGRRRLRAVELAQLLLDGIHLATEEELALGLLHALLDIGADALADRQVAEGLLGPAEHQTQPRLDVGRLEHLDLLLELEVGRVAGGIGERVGVGHGREHRDDTGGTAGLEDVLDDGAVLLGQLEGGLGHGLGVDGLDLHPQGGAGAGDAGADASAALATDDEAERAAGELARLLDDRHGADVGVAPVDAGHEQQATVSGRGRLGGGTGFVGLERHRDHHAREDDPRGEREQGQGVRQIRVVEIGTVGFGRCCLGHGGLPER